MFKVNNPSGITNNNRVYLISIFIKLLKYNIFIYNWWYNRYNKPHFKINYSFTDK